MRLALPNLHSINRSSLFWLGAGILCCGGLTYMRKRTNGTLKESIRCDTQIIGKDFQKTFRKIIDEIQA
ncbi:MAG: hypothetical protein OXE59_08695 [Bacteroidetes bacterium]|nr:hypothetical protein [Bacteroidota bacterium]